MAKRTAILDIEVFPNFFFVGVEDFKKKEITNFEVSERVDDRELLYEWLMTFDGYLVTFNGLWYDEIILKKLMKDYEKLRLLPVDKFLRTIKNFSDQVIDQDNHFDDIKFYKWYKKFNWTSIDLMCYWSKMLRLSKKMSLKSLAIQLNFDEIQELPFEHDKKLKVPEMEEIVRYNNRNDLGVTRKLFETMKEDILLRGYIKDEYDLDCWSMDAPKIAGELLIRDYCKQTFDDSNFENEDEYIKDFKKQKFEMYTGLVEDIMEDFNVDFEIPDFQKVKELMMSSDRSFSYKFPLIYGDSRVIVSCGVGGLHSIQKDDYIQSDDNWQMVTSDYASLYPNIIINWRCIRFQETLEKYLSVKLDRLVAKKEKNKVKDKLLKLILNSLSGLLDNQHSPLYYPEGALRMRIIGQLILLKTAEVAMLNGARIISLNTDGLEVLIPNGSYDKYVQDLKVCEDMFKIDLEHDKYKKVVYANVNNYIAITESGSVKRKGFFKFHKDIPLGDSVNEQIIPIALNNYFVKGIPIEDTIRKPYDYGLHIYDYCVSKKVDKTYTVIQNNVIQQRLNRYYFSKSGSYLFKRRKGILNHMHKGVGVKIFNKFVEKTWEEYDIDYSYYISKARTLINELETDIRQRSLF